MTYAGKIGRADAKLDWTAAGDRARSRTSAPSIPRPARSRDSVATRSRCGRAEPRRAASSAARPGPSSRVGADGDRRRVRRRGCCACRTVQPAGGKRMSAGAFAAGRGLAPGARFALDRLSRCSTSSRPRRRRPQVLDGATLPAALAAVRRRRADPRPCARAGARVRHAAPLGHARRARAGARGEAARPIRCSPRSSRSRSTSSSTRKAPPFAVVDQRGRRRSARRAAGSEGARQRAAAPVPARARRAERRGRAREPGRALVASALVDRARAAGSARRIGETILAAGNERPPLTLRVNRARDLARGAARALRARRDRDAIAVGERGAHRARAATGARAARASTTARSRCRMLGAQLAAPLLARRRRHARARRLRRAGRQDDAPRSSCADVDLTALDSDAARLRARRARTSRACGLDGPRRAHRRRRRGASRGAGGTARPFDRILADVPCTASGVVRRHPDGKWLRRKSDLAAFAAQQRRDPRRLWPLLARGGALLYATCSVFAAENEAQIAEFLARTPDALRETISLPGDIAACRGPTLAFAGRRGPQSGRLLLRAAPQGVRRLAARRRRPRRHARRDRLDSRRHAASSSSELRFAFAPPMRRRRRSRARSPSSLSRSRSPRPRHAPTRSRQARGAARRGRRGRCSTPNSTSSLNSDARGGAAARHPALLRARSSSSSAPRWYWFDEKVLQASTQYSRRRTTR